MLYLGIDLGGTRIKMGLYHNDRIVCSRILKVRTNVNLQAHLPLIDEIIEEMLKGSNRSNLDGIAMAFPGLVNPEQKKVLGVNEKYEDANSMNLESYYRSKWDTSFYIDNDARMAAVGEWHYGAGRDTDDLVMVTLGTGIGTAVVMEGKLLRGRHFQAGCLGGHFVVNYKGNPCNCGNIGCLEAEAATWNLELQVRKHPNFTQSRLFKSIKIDFAILFKAALAGDQVAIEVRDHCLNIWAAGVISFIHAYDPEVVILGGGILKSAEIIIPFIQEKVKKQAWTPWGEVKIRQSELQDQAAIRGAIYCLQNNI